MIDPLYQAMALQFPERLREHLLGDSVDQSQKFVVADWPLCQERDDQQHPFAGDDLQHPPRRAGGAVDVSKGLP